MPRPHWLITGASGQLGGHVVRQLSTLDTGVTILALAGRGDVDAAGVEVCRIDLRKLDELRSCMLAFRPTHILHLGAITAVGDCHAHPADAERVNVEATRVLLEAAAALHARLVFSSTDMVFDGEAAPYGESDPPRPVSHYGRTKAAAERLVTAADDTLCVRLPLMYGVPQGRRETTFVKQIAALRCGQPLRLFTDEFRTPVWLADAARAIIGLAGSDKTGLLHVAGPQRLSRYELVARCAALLNIPQPNLVPASRCDVDSPEPRPADLSLDGRRLREQFPHLVPGPIRAQVFSDLDTQPGQ